MQEVTFQYATPPDKTCLATDFVLRVPTDLRSKAELLSALANAGRFPDYFGENWDALQECLGDLSWIENRRVVVVHEDLCLINSPQECRIYLEILNTALTDWANKVASTVTQSLGASHELRVVFPTEVQTAVEAILR